ncbi:MAG TPA: DNA-formamidopyrimidine glycosylase family protein [Thermoanaerobaculia bacterium]|nr:DNA-formamidopyrimidine glycosylase family protein [Thermoanaerobaculia bacterium]
MPEGDTIHRAARTLHTALAGKRVTRFESVYAQLARVEVAGRTIERVVANGKNLIFDFSGNLHLRTHMRMNGSWHIYRPGERWQKRRIDMRIVIGTSDFVAVAFNVPVAEFHNARSLAEIEIGPDLLGETFDVDDAIQRIRAHNELEIAEVLLNQRVIAGIGNEYKNELLFIEKINPFTRVANVSDAQLASLLKTARKLMQVNVTKREAGRWTTGSMDPRKAEWVFGRAGEPCRVCGTRIEFRKHGVDVRGTYWCPRCQGDRGA